MIYRRNGIKNKINCADVVEKSQVKKLKFLYTLAAAYMVMF